MDVYVSVCVHVEFNASCVYLKQKNIKIRKGIKASRRDFRKLMIKAIMLHFKLLLTELLGVLEYSSLKLCICFSSFAI